MALDDKEMREYLESFKNSLESIAADTSAIREGIGVIQEKVENIEHTLGPRVHEGGAVKMSSIAGKLESIREEISETRFG